MILIPTYVWDVLLQSFQMFQGKSYVLAEIYTSEVVKDYGLLALLYVSMDYTFLTVWLSDRT
jgi:hypothetical protein